jgi:hypothetical protein
VEDCACQVPLRGRDRVGNTVSVGVMVRVMTAARFEGIAGCCTLSYCVERRRVGFVSWLMSKK